ncbi:CpsD/CapB family tyrosine-protein kinase [Sphingomonas flavalba]|uniref:CpsD/CapB family tyrosine-protein kinase n=1 Tax=Sphingomonas flavalba TaxID=2559804 RepID=UPI0039E112EA
MSESVMTDEAIDDTAAPVIDAETARDAAEAEREYHIASVMLSDPTGLEAEAIRGLRTRIVAQHVREGRRAIAFCTPSTESGCTFVAFNLAVAMAQIGIPTVIVDCDLRNPGIAELCGIGEDEPGLAELLGNDTTHMAQSIHGEVLPNLSVLPAGNRPTNPQELLSSDRFRTLVDQLLRQFQLTILDTTPANTCTDAQRVATVAGYSAIVARKHQTHYSDIQTLARLLRADRSAVVGTVLNDF